MGAGEIRLPTREARGSHRRPDLPLARFEGEEGCVAAIYEDGVRRLVEAVEDAAAGEHEQCARVSAGLRAGLDFLAADPSLAHLLLVESLTASSFARLEHERSLERLAHALRRSGADVAVSEETARLQAGGLASHLSGRVLAGEVQRLPESHGPLLQYLLAPLPSSPVAARDGYVRRAAGG